MKLFECVQVLTALAPNPQLKVVVVAVGINNRDNNSKTNEDTIEQLHRVGRKFPCFHICEVPINHAWGTRTREEVKNINKLLRGGFTDESDLEHSFIPLDFDVFFKEQDIYHVHINQMTADNLVHHIKRRVDLNL